MAKRTAQEADHGSSSIVYSIPEEFKQLAKQLVRAVYRETPSMIVLMDALVNHGCIKDGDIPSLIALDRKCLKEAIAKLKHEHLIKSKDLDDPYAPPEARNRKATFWYIDYRTLINVVKYKSLKLHKLLEHERKQARNSSHYECPRCKKTYTDLDFADLLGPDGLFWCPRCPSTQLEDKADREASDRANKLMNTWNVQSRAFEPYLKKADSIVLSDTLLQARPPRQNLAIVRDNHMNKPRAKRVKSNTTNMKTKVSSAVRYNSFEEKTTVTFTEDADTREVMKAQPNWLQGSTVAAAQSSDQIDSSSIVPAAVIETSAMATEESDLLANLTALDQANAAMATTNGHDNQENDNDDDDDDNGEDDESSDDEWEAADAPAKVQVGGKWVAVEDVDEDMRLEMTTEEFEAYSKELEKTL
eukprot:TRINITY_DN11311_c1_g2_i2.p1 TRINITY_DN11311_c1_g2~~TRINITY_DN11311_c1_g2_i2.p1  ORF type:complete len:416 (+),score=95.51 TRINITY_DN11311_c1_g2_i2:50-1297(+)